MAWKDRETRAETDMRFVSYAVIGLLGLVGASGYAVADGGLGFHPPAFLPDILQPTPPTPYHAICTAPPTFCDVDYMYPIRQGKSCWCRSGLFTYSSGVTRPIR